MRSWLFILTEIFTEEFDPSSNEIDYIPLRVGDCVVCRIDGELCIGEIRKIIDEDKLKIVSLGTTKRRAILSKDNVQLIDLWIYPEIRRKI